MCVVFSCEEKKMKKEELRREAHDKRGGKGVEGYGIEVCWYLIGDGEKKEDKRKHIWMAKNAKGKRMSKFLFKKFVFG